MSTKEDLIKRAEIAEQTERYNDMAQAMKAVAEEHPKLTNTERNLLSVAYKNVVGARRSAWRVISNLEAKSSADDEFSKTASDYKMKIANELNDICREVLVRRNHFKVCLLNV